MRGWATAVAGIFLVAIAACAAPPERVHLPRSSDYRSKLDGLIAGGQITAGAARVTLDTAKLAAWTARSTALSAGSYQGKVGNQPAGLPADSFGIRCEYNMDTPLWYTSYDLGPRTLRSDKNRLALRDGSCTELQQGDLSATVGIYNFAEALSVQVPHAERAARLEEALKAFTLSTRAQTDQEVRQAGGMLVGEAAGYLYEIRGSFPPHAASRDVKTNNYYRLVLVGERTIVAMDVYGAPSTQAAKLEAAALQVAQALRY